MEQSSSANIGVEKLRSAFILGMTSNSSTIVGLVAVWVAFAKAEVLSSFWITILTVLSFFPIFMGDALDSYFLGRIRTEKEKGWDDIQITETGRKSITKNFTIFRLTSILTSLALALFMFFSFTSNENGFYFSKIAIVFFFSINFFRSLFFMKTFFAPRIPAFGGKALTKKAAIISLVFLVWFIYLWLRPQIPFSKLFILSNGLIYFLISAFLHPLPSRFSIFRPGRPSKKKFSFKVELIDEDCGLGNWDKISNVCGGISERDDYTLLSNVKMPLLELPLFQSWGKSFINVDRKNILLVLASETKSGVHRSLVSWNGEGYYITTDFGAPDAKFPSTILYENIDCSISLQEMIDIHNTRGNEGKKTLGATNTEIYVKLEELVKKMIYFLESEIPKKKLNE